jgi:subtilisin family serine protease
MVRIATSLLAVAASAASLVGAMPEGSTHKNIRVPGGFIFEFDAREDNSDFLNTLDEEGTMRMNLNYTLFKGASVQLRDLENADKIAARMAELPSVRNVWPLENFPVARSKPHWVSDGSAPAYKKQKRDQTTLSTHIMTQVDRLRAEGFTGQGVRVGLVDSGVDYNHPALGGCFGEGCLIAAGADFAGDDFDGTADPVPDDDPMDCDGHGTHTAGILAAQPNEFGFTGVAPDITIGAYKIFGCSAEIGGPDLAIAGINRAFEDGSDVIAVPFGLPLGWAFDPFAIAVSRVVDAGVPVIAAADNQGTSGLFFSSSPANGRQITAVASFDSTTAPFLLYSSNYTINGSASTEFGYTPGQPSNWDGISLPVWTPPADSNVTASCVLPEDTPDLSGFITVMPRVACSYDNLAAAVLAAGGQYVLFYNQDPFFPVVETADVREVAGIQGSAVILPGVAATFIRAAQTGGQVVLDMVSPNDTTINMLEMENTVTGGAAGYYSSQGPTYDMVVKPQFGAPGGNILSTWPLRLGGYAVMTSGLMATPFAAGVYALIGQVRGSFDPVELQSLLSTHSNPQLFNDRTGFSEYLAPVPQQGAGLVQAYDAAYGQVIVTPESMSFNDTDNFIDNVDITLRNTGNTEVTYQLSHVPAITMYSLEADSPNVAEFPNERVEVYASIEFDSDSVTIPAGGEVVVNVRPTVPSNLVATRLPLYSGYIAMNGTDGSSLSVPYIGLAGSLNRATVLAPDGVQVTVNGDQTFTPAAEGTTFTLPADGVATADTIAPVLDIELAMGSPFADVTLIPTENCGNSTVAGQSVGSAIGFPVNFITRGQSPLPFTGVLANGDVVAACEYRVNVRALHIFGDPNNEDDWDVAESQAFRIEYA